LKKKKSKGQKKQKSRKRNCVNEVAEREREGIGRVVNVFVRVREGKTIKDLTSTQIWQNSKSTVSKNKKRNKG